jgi:L-ascorbate metabolism protein UlaG (beta-lactamase superfamily)
MNLTWLGTAGFIVKTPEGEIAFDPFLSRGRGAASPFTPRSFQNTQALFVGHGHFDHAYDIPEIVAASELKVFAPGLTGQVLRLRGVPPARLLHAGNDEILFKPYKMRAFHSSHSRFDLPLVLSTMKRCGVRGCLEACSLGLAYPKGLVQTYLFEASGKKVLFVSSAGCTDKELETYRKLEVDYLLAPLQGHTSIQQIAARMTALISPRVVVPHHHDDFFPPLSQQISVEGFREELTSLGYKGKVLEIPIFQDAQV